MSAQFQTEYPNPNESPGLLLWRVTNAWQRRVRAALSEHELTHVQFVLLAALASLDSAEPVSQRRLAQVAGTDVMMTSQVIRALAATKLVVRAPYPGDGRAVAVSITAAGLALANRAVGDVERVDREYFGLLQDGGRSFTAALHELDAGDSRSAGRGGVTP